jgi:hypothetical protein
MLMGEAGAGAGAEGFTIERRYSSPDRKELFLDIAALLYEIDRGI